MNFALDLLFSGLQQLLVGAFSALLQVPLDVLTSLLTSLLVTGG